MQRFNKNKLFDMQQVWGKLNSVSFNQTIVYEVQTVMQDWIGVLFMSCLYGILFYTSSKVIAVFWWNLVGETNNTCTWSNIKYSKTKIPWSEKQDTAVFRGTATGCTMNIDENPRLKVAFFDKEWSKEPDLNGSEEGTAPYLNAGITKFPNRYKTTE